MYHGAAIPELFGRYVFGDFSHTFGSPAGRIFTADLDAGSIEEFIIGTDGRALNLYVKGFGTDGTGEVYVLAGSNVGPHGTGGVISKMVDLCKARIRGDINDDCEVHFLDSGLMAEHRPESRLR